MLLSRLDEHKRAEWDRSLPIPELLNDRWARAKRLGFGDRASIYDSAVVLGDVSVGADTWIGPNTILDGSGGGLEIGLWCTVSAGTQIYTHDTVRRSLSGGTVDRHAARTEIGDRTYIGPLCVVTAGVRIGAMCVVASHSLVNTDVESRSVMGGQPARRLGSVVGDGDEIRLDFG